MNYNNFNEILNRKEIENNILNLLKNYNYVNNVKKGIFIHGNNGSGKTTFVKNMLKDNNLDYIYFDGTDIRSNNFIETLYNTNSSNMNVISLFNMKPKTIIIVIDDIDNINSNDKTLLANLIKLVRPKKTKKQKLERRTNSPIIFIGNKDNEKKIIELMKVCNIFKLDSPTDNQINNILIKYLKNYDYVNLYINKIILHVEYNFHKIFNIINIINDKNFNVKLLDNILKNISISVNIKDITKNLINNKYTFNDNILSENDRTIVGLLYHENIIDILDNNNKDHINLYYKFLENYCITDFIDRIIYQKQLWQLNDLNYIIKILYNNNLINNPDNKLKILNDDYNLIRFTKILTKYSTEYNNTTFINNICNELTYNIKDMYNLFLYLFENYKDNEIITYLENYNISELDVTRIKRIISFQYIID